jgi:hypothetical protein
VTETLEHTAQQIADGGRDALVARLRPAFEQAAATHGEGLDLDDEQLEQMVQRAADQADGVQWRRALAHVATEQLGIGLGEALTHPAVARAQTIVGAPSYEDALDELTGDEQPVGVAEEPASLEAGDAEEAGLAREEPASADDADDGEEHPSADAAPSPSTVAAAPPEPVPGWAPDPAAAAPPMPADEPGEIRLRAVHLGGIANLAPAEGDLELHLSEAGLDILRGPERSPLGRLTWDEIVALETPVVGGRFLRKKHADAHFVIRSAQGSASFEIPGVTTEELSEHITPMLERHQT